eukprot:SAG31_NODE_2431_length_5707_cov_2.157810_7_plen_82_part_00
MRTVVGALPHRMQLVVATLTLLAVAAPSALEEVATAADLHVNLQQQPRAFPHYWTRCFGSGHALMGTRADWQVGAQRSTTA